MSFQPLTSSPGDGGSIGSDGPYGQLVRPDGIVNFQRAERRRKTFLAISLFALVIFVSLIVVLGLIYVHPSNVTEDTRQSIPAQIHSKPDNQNMGMGTATTKMSQAESHARGAGLKETTQFYPSSSAATPKATSGLVASETRSAIKATNATNNQLISSEIFQTSELSVDRSENSHDSAESYNASHEDSNTLILSKTKRSRSRNSQRQRAQPTLPPNPASEHPVSLLYQMKLAPNFEYLMCPKENQNFRTTLTVGQGKFIGYGLGKKKSKKLAAQIAITHIYPSVNYTDTPTPPQILQLAQECGFSENQSEVGTTE